MKKSLLGLTALAMAAALPRVVLAGDPGAEALFQEGKAALDRGAFDEACGRLAESNKLEPLAGTSYFLGDCEEKRGRIASAWAAFLESRQRMDPSDDRLSIVEERINKLQGRLPKLVVRLAPNVPDDAKVWRADAEVGRASVGVSIPVDPGVHVLRVEAKGFEPRSVEITAVEGETASVTLELGPAVKEVSVPGASTPDSPVPLIVGGVLLGVGAIGMGAGVGMGAIAAGDYDDAASACPAGACTQAGFDARTDARGLGDAGTGVFIGGAAVAAAGLVTMIVDLATGSSATPQADEPKATALWFSDREVGAAWSVRW